MTFFLQNHLFVIILNTFICEAEGELLERTNETEHIRSLIAQCNDRVAEIEREQADLCAEQEAISVKISQFVEVTTDRKTWHKLARVSRTGVKWKEVLVSLNDFIGNDYVQTRFRYESSGEGEVTTWSREIYIDDLFINFEPISDTTGIPTQEKFHLSISPNPSDGIVRITSGLEQEYNISVYNILGVKLFSDNNFSDGTLDLNFLSKGTYFISINNGVDRISKRIVVR